MFNIDLPLLYKALNYYESLGYQMISTPYLINKDIIDITLPDNREAKEHNGLYYVGSAEQSAYQLFKDGKLPYDKWMMLTPCQRDEEILDDNHLEIFLKLELMLKGNQYNKIIEDVLSFYNNDNCIVISTEQGKDILFNNIEIGSFGTREVFWQDFSFGTGLAMPRYTQALLKGEEE